MMNKNILILSGGIVFLLIVVIMIIVFSSRHSSTTHPNSTHPNPPKKNYLVYSGYYLVMNNNSTLNASNNIADATPIIVSDYKIPGADTVFHMVKTEDGQKFISCSSSIPNKVEYTDNVVLNYDTNGRGGTFASLNLVPTDNGYVVNSIGGNSHVIIGEAGTALTNGYTGVVFNVVSV